MLWSNLAESLTSGDAFQKGEMQTQTNDKTYYSLNMLRYTFGLPSCIDERVFSLQVVMQMVV